jgi:hypothetical protein
MAAFLCFFVGEKEPASLANEYGAGQRNTVVIPAQLRLENDELIFRALTRRRGFA